jgi:isopentenyl-diphosphate delta-isomerase
MTLPLMKRLEEIGVAAIDVAGLGGTHWGRIEGHRGDQQIKRVSETFANWGVPTVESLCNASSLKGVSEIWASGGIRTGLDAAKSLALGAKQVGFAKPALENALKGESALLNWFQTIEKEFSVAMFCTGSSSPKELKGKYDIK